MTFGDVSSNMPLQSIRVPGIRPMVLTAEHTDDTPESGWWIEVGREEIFLTDAQADKLARKLLFEGDERPQGGAGAHNGA